MVSGQVIRGEVLSKTITVNEQFSPPDRLHVTVVAPTEKNEPEAGEQVAGPQPPTTTGGEYETLLPHVVAFVPI